MAKKKAAETTTTQGKKPAKKKEPTVRQTALQKLLNEASAGQTPDQFRTSVVQFFIGQTANLAKRDVVTDEEMLVRPTVASWFVEQFRKSNRAYRNIPEYVILRALISARKKGMVPKRDKRLAPVPSNGKHSPAPKGKAKPKGGARGKSDFSDL